MKQLFSEEMEKISAGKVSGAFCFGLGLVTLSYLPVTIYLGVVHADKYVECWNN